tara:strand:- start:56775 stop:57677 length:903 start_codon:yes stop_codon:yes gene_type:complete
MHIKEFLSLGTYLNINNDKIFVIDIGKSDNTIVIINGYPTVSYDYHKVIIELAKHYRVIIHDHFGFGFSDLPNSYCFSIIDQADVCIKVWKKLNLKKFKILASNYGSKVAKELLYRKNANLLPFNITSLAIANNSKKDYYVNLNTIQQLLENKNISKYKELLIEYKNRNLFNDIEDTEIETVNNDVKIEKIWKKFNQIVGQKEVLVLSSYNEESYIYWHRWMKAIKDSKIPVKIFWRKDDLANINSLMLKLATSQPKNVEIIENKNCFVIENEPVSWLLMVLKELDKTTFSLIKNKFVSI